jgi:hypothetical protein
MNEGQPIALSEAKQSGRKVLDHALQSAHRAAIGKRLAQEFQIQQASLESTIQSCPLAEEGLRALMQPWIDEARAAFDVFCRTGQVETGSLEEVSERDKARYWQKLLVMERAYPALDIVEAHDRMCAVIDSANAAHQQAMHEQQTEYTTRMSRVRDAILELNLGEINPDQYTERIIQQLG